MNHQLIANGAAFDDDGDRLFSKTTSGMGRAKCSCGWMSDPVEFGRTRKKLHADHKDATEEDVEEDVEELLEAVEEAVTPAAEEEVVEDAVTPAEETVTPAEEEAEEAVEEGEKVQEKAFSVQWPSSVARLFWRALAKDGSDILARAVGAQRKSNESKGELRITGPAIVAMDLAERLPAVFIGADAALKKWRKMSSEYKRHDLKTAEGRRAGFAEEQDFLRGFCSAVAGNENADAYHSAGHVAGLAFLEIEGLL